MPIGMVGAALWGGARAFAAGGWQGFGRAAWNFAKSIPNNIKVNYIESFRKFGLSIRALMGVQNTTATYGNTGEAGITDFTKGIFAIEIGTYESTYNIITGKGTWHDWTGLSPIGKKLGDLENSLLKEKTKTKVKDSEYTQEGENKTAKTKRLEEEAANSRDGEAYEMYNSIADPIADVLGAGKVSHPKEWQAMIDDLKANGFDIIYRLDEAMAYSPGLNKGKSGQIIINEDASISALIHEYEHFITDKNDGYVGFEGVYDPNFRTQSKIFSYQKEIDFVRENLENNIDLINHLKNNLQKEISDFSKRIGAPDDPTVLQNLENILNN
ncbi:MULTISPECIES: hypothetical protein [unclassified Apibacter]|uniref:hypothetical protein n=2 Tax=unclassified Apibacter TaxID=2630820 RepID=UPI00136C6093|nr:MULTISPECIES: hypothetical protein [unclassified Apibacter]MCX8677229.1 hypothetical protein [Apibacter sp. B3919]MXO26702.1 hypothetical protein [Apibacter sp. B3813]MXO30682.1 hypothetical protein [Apibacter sp. B3912]MXP01864.1 hypothetical protein [Apibacter sp. B3918]